jgi:hypothetical protein
LYGEFKVRPFNQELDGFVPGSKLPQATIFIVDMKPEVLKMGRVLLRHLFLARKHNVDNRD